MKRTTTGGDGNRLRRYWDKQARSYDKTMTFWERILFGDTRAWVCSQATGDVLEVATGTGLNLRHYPKEVRLTTPQDPRPDPTVPQAGAAAPPAFGLEGPWTLPI